MAKPKLSILIFSRNDIDAALSLINDVYGLSDDIIVFDSSRKAQHERLLRAKRNGRLNKVRIHYVVPLGYPDPLRMYAMSKCRHEWVLLLDTNERLSKSLKGNILDVIRDADCNAFAIKRYENVSADGTKTKFFTWQIRIFRKSRVSFKGMPHEQAIIEGDLGRLEQKYFYIEHRTDLMHREVSVYGKILEVFGRMSYGTVNQNLLYYLYKIQMPRRKDKPTLSARLLSYALSAYEMLGSKRLDQELTDSDYVLFLFMLYAGYSIKQLSLRTLLSALPSARVDAERIKRYQTRGLTRMQMFRAAEAINKIGIIDILELYDDRAVKHLNAKYGPDDRGIELLMDIIAAWERKGERGRAI